MAASVVNFRPVAAPVLPIAAVVTGFEIGILLRCVRTGSGRHEPRISVPTSVEVGRAAAAARLVTLFSGLGLQAHVDSYTAGGWHQYMVHRVVCPDADDRELMSSWCTGYRRLCATETSLSARQRRHREDLASAAWRSALLASGSRTRGGRPAVRVTDPDLAVILMRAARVLETPVTLHSAAGRHVIEVATAAAGAALKALVSADPPVAADRLIPADRIRPSGRWTAGQREVGLGN
jgi:hypothetical protein